MFKRYEAATSSEATVNTLLSPSLRASASESIVTSNSDYNENNEPTSSYNSTRVLKRKASSNLSTLLSNNRTKKVCRNQKNEVDQYLDSDNREF